MQRRIDADPAVGAVGGAFMEALLAHRPAGPNSALQETSSSAEEGKGKPFADLGSTTGNPNDIALLPSVVSNSPSLQQLLPSCTTDAEFEAQIPFGRPMRRLFPTAAAAELNFGSYGCTPLPVTAAMALYVPFCIDTATTHAFRNDLLPRIHDVVHVMRRFTHTADDDFLALSDNAAEAWNTVAESLIFDPRRWLPPTPTLDAAATRVQQGPGGSPSSSSTVQRKVVIAFAATQYPMVSQVVSFWRNRTDADSRVVFDQRLISIPPDRLTDLDAESSTEIPREKRGEAFAQFYASAAVGADVVIVDHVTSSPSFLWPVRRICELIRKQNPNALIVVDGAHGVGQLPLDLTRGDAACWDIATTDELESDELARSSPQNASPSVEFDAYFSNFHKWLSAPKSSAFLWTKGRHAPFLHPPVISVFYRQDLDLPEEERLAIRGPAPPLGGECVLPVSTELRRTLEFAWRGTRDHTAWLALADTLVFRQLIGGERRIRRYCRNIAREGAARVAEALGTELHLSSPALCPSLVGVRLPHPVGKDGRNAAKAAVNATRARAVMVADYVHGSSVYVRVSGQIYVGLEDFDTAAAVLLEELRKQNCIA